MQELSDRLKQISHLPDSQIELIISASSEEDAERLVSLPDEQFQTAINAIVSRLNSVTSRINAPTKLKLNKSQDNLNRADIKQSSPTLSKTQDNLNKAEIQEAPDLSSLRLKKNRDEKPLTGTGAKFRPQGHSEAPEQVNITAPKTNPGEVDTSSILYKETEEDYNNDTVLFKATDLDSTVDQIAQLGEMRETKEITETQIIRDAEDFEKIRKENPSLTMVNPNPNDPYLEESFQADIEMHTQTDLPEIKVKRKKSPLPIIIGLVAVAIIAGLYFVFTSVDFSSKKTTDIVNTTETDTNGDSQSQGEEDTSPAQKANTSTRTASTTVKEEPQYQAPFISEGEWGLHLVPGFKSKNVFDKGQLEKIRPRPYHRTLDIYCS